MVKTDKKKTIKTKKIRIRFCPKCKSNNIDMIAGGQIGMWKCSNCGFQSAIFPEIEIDDRKENKKAKKK